MDPIHDKKAEYDIDVNGSKYTLEIANETETVKQFILFSSASLKEIAAKLQTAVNTITVILRQMWPQNKRKQNQLYRLYSGRQAEKQ